VPGIGNYAIALLLFALVALSTLLQQASAQPSQPPPSASERLSGSTQNVSAASQRLSGSSANVTRDGSGTGSGGDATSSKRQRSSVFLSPVRRNRVVNKRYYEVFSHAVVPTAQSISVIFN